MKNVVIFVVLAIITIAALVGWSAVRTMNDDSTKSERVNVASTPTPTIQLGTAVGRSSSTLGSATASAILDTTKGGVSFGSTSSISATQSSSLGLFTTPTVTPKIIATPIIASTSNIVTYTDQGFNPKTTTVKTGTMVKFLNQSTKRMWVVSQEIAGGKKLDGMNMGTSVGKDGFYEFQFNTLGTWGFVDQNNVQQSGSIIVTQ